MQPVKLVEHMKSNADRMSEGLIRKIRASNKCGELMLRVPADEHKQYSLQIITNIPRPD